MTDGFSVIVGKALYHASVLLDLVLTQQLQSYGLRVCTELGCPRQKKEEHERQLCIVAYLIQSLRLIINADEEARKKSPRPSV